MLTSLNIERGSLSSATVDAVTETQDTASTRVFNSPELCEQIFLGGLSSYDLLKLMLVNKQFYEIILETPSIRKTIGLVVDHAPVPYTPFPGPRMRRYMDAFHESIDNFVSSGALRVSLDNTRLSHRTTDQTDRHWFEAYFELYCNHSANNTVNHPDSPSGNQFWLSGTRLKIGRRVRTLLVTQPPIRRLSASSHCGTMVTRYYPEGVCVGDLYDILREVLTICRTRGCSINLESWTRFAEHHRSPKVYFFSGPPGEPNSTASI